jgi:hypothetical protein
VNFLVVIFASKEQRWSAMAGGFRRPTVQSRVCAMRLFEILQFLLSTLEVYVVVAIMLFTTGLTFAKDLP